MKAPMKDRRRWNGRMRMRATILGALVGILAIPAMAQAQRPPREMSQAMHQRMEMMQDVMQRMQRLQDRAQTMERDMIRDMDRLRSQDQLGDQDRVRLRDQERIRDMAHAMSTAAGQMHQAMARVRDLGADGDAPWNREMQQEMERLREHWEGLCTQMEEGLQIMERLRERLGNPG